MISLLKKGPMGYELNLFIYITCVSEKQQNKVCSNYTVQVFSVFY